jgi:ferredoxin
LEGSLLLDLYLINNNNFGGFNMAHVISDECVSCGACAATCPVSAISEGDTKYVVDPDVCIDCCACEDGCPTGAIKGE